MFSFSSQFATRNARITNDSFFYVRFTRIRKPTETLTEKKKQSQGRQQRMPPAPDCFAGADWTGLQPLCRARANLYAICARRYDEQPEQNCTFLALRGPKKKRGQDL